MAIPSDVPKLGTFQGATGPAGSIAYATAEHIPATEEPSVEMVGPESNRGAHFRIPAGLPGTNAVENDAAFAAYLGADGSETHGAHVQVVQGAYQRLSVLDHGAVQSAGVVDASAAIQTLINAAAADVLASSFVRSRTVFIPGGRYRLDSQVVQPPYVKVICEGTVIFETYVTGDSAWWISPLATDPTGPVPGVMGKQQWLWGTLLDAVGGAVVFANCTGARDGQTGLELGPRVNLTELRPLARYEVANVAMQEYGVGVKWNAINHYICTYTRFHIENCDTPVRYGAGVNVLNSGEKVTWVDSVFATNPAGFAAHEIDCDTINLQFWNCSFDYLSAIVRFTTASRYSRVDFFGGHVEGINRGIRNHARGGWVVSESNSGIRPEVAIHGVPFVAFDREVQFKGSFALRANFDFRATQLDSLPYAKGYLCEDTVQVMEWHVRQWDSHMNPARAIGGVTDPTLKNQSTGAQLSDLTGWTVSVGSGVTGSVVASGPRAGDKALSCVFASGAYRRFTKNARLPVRPGQTVNLTVAVKRTAGVNLAVQPSVIFYDGDGGQISETPLLSLNFGTVVDQWVLPVTTIRRDVPSGAAWAQVRWDLNCAGGSSGVAQLFSDFYAWVE